MHPSALFSSTHAVYLCFAPATDAGANSDSESNADASPTRPPAPTLSVRPLPAPGTDESALQAQLYLVQQRLQEQFSAAPFSSVMDEAACRINLLRPNPPTVHPVRWQGHQCLCAWRAGTLEGLLDIATGFDSESIELRGDAPVGFIRFLLLPADPARVDQVVSALFVAAESFWRQQRVGYLKAFHMSAGYPQFQGGLGALPGSWDAHIRVLTGAGFQFTDRFYALRRPLDQPMEELMPVGQVSLVMRGKPTDRYYQLYRQVDQIGHARVCELTTTEGERTIRIANLLDLFIDPEWRGQDLGKWLLRRLLNDALLQGYHQMLVHVPHRAFILQNLLTQHGFQEQNYRGYTLEKALTR